MFLWYFYLLPLILVIFRKMSCMYVCIYLNINAWNVSCHIGVVSHLWALFKWNKTFLKLRENLIGPNLVACCIAEV